MDYIEGAKLLGCISELLKKDGQESFAELCEKGKLRCSNAYLSMDGERLMEVPASLYAIKNDKQHYIDKLYEKEKIAAMENFEQKHREEWLNELYNRITEIKQS